MTKPMYCPMSFTADYIMAAAAPSTGVTLMECTTDCAWSVKFNGDYYCAVAFGPAGINANSRSLKDDVE